MLSLLYDIAASAISNTLSTQPVDPNEIIGLEGYDASGSEDTMRWVSPTQSLAYTIYFENDPELAMAAASKVAITMPVHPKLNYSTFGVGSFGFGGYVFPVEGAPSSYQTRIDLRDSMGIYLDVVAGLDIVHHEAFWIFQSIDPATGLPPIDINLGFLPINDSLHSGEGFVTCTIKPNACACVTGDTLTATASIVFDINEPIATNTWVNTVDAVAPTSTLVPATSVADSLSLTFTGEDDEGGCGVKQYKLYYSVNDGAYQMYAVYLAGDTARVPVESGMEYRFFTLAEDHVGNCEPMKSQPDYTVGTTFVTLAVNAFPQEAGTVTGGGTYTVNDTAQLSATAAEGYHFVDWMSQGAPVSTENPYSAVVSQNQTYTAYFERNAYPLQTLAASGSIITVTDLNGNEVPSGSTVLHFDELLVEVNTKACYAVTSLLLNGMAITSGDTITVTDSVLLTTTTVSLSTSELVEATACDEYLWNDSVYTQSGDYVRTFTNVFGCDSTVTLHLIVNHSAATELHLSLCDGLLPYHYINGVIDTVFGTDTPPLATITYSLSTATGCDSVVTLHVSRNYAVVWEFAETVCDQYVWNDSVYTHSGDYVQTFTNVIGCDSVVTLHLTVNSSNIGDTTAIACDSYVWYGTTYTLSGSYTHTLTNANGCDSVVTLHLTVNQSSIGDTTAIACDSYLWYGTTYTSSGNYTHTLTNANGCDSVVTLHLTVNQSSTGDTTAIACGSYVWYGTTYTSSGNYAHTLTNANGCDSVVTLHLTVNHSNTGDTTAIACDRYVWYGVTYTSNGNYTHTLTNANGCDSVVTLHLTINSSSTGDTTAIACGSYAWYGTTYTSSGHYTHTLTNANGCDSVVTLHLTVNHSNIGYTTAIACDRYVWYGTTYTSSGNYTHTLTNAYGCDSVVTLHLTVNQSTTGDTTAIACDSYVWYGTTYTSSGNYTHTLTNANGCDSVVTLHLTVNPSSTGDTTAIACGSYDWYGTTYTSSGNYTYTLTNANGCDSVVTLRLTVNSSNTGDTTAIACGSYVWYGATYTASGNYTHTLTNANGCDSVVTLHLTINSPVAESVEATACESYTWNESVYTASGNYMQTFTAANGCDSVVTLHLTINSPVAESVEATACESYPWIDQTYTTSGDYTQTFTAANGCDSVVTLHLTINSPATELVEATACESYTWIDQTYTASGDYTQTFTAANGCDSVVTLHLTINSPVAESVEATACESYTWNESVYTASGDYTQTFTAANGCDSVVTLHLTINSPVAESVDATACGSYTWNDQTYTANGDYTQIFTAANGCDSVVTLHLTLLEAPTLQAISGDPEICINQFANYVYDISDPNYQYRWFKDNMLYAENVPALTLHEMSEGMVQLTMQVVNGQSGCAADTSLSVQVVNRIAPDTTEIRRKVNSNILICQPVYSDYGQVHYRWGYTDLNTNAEVVMPGDHNYCLYDIGIDTLSYRYWVETYLNGPVGAGCNNRSYYAYGYITTSTPDYGDNMVEAYLSNNHIVLYVSSLSPENITASLYDVNGKLLLSKGYGTTDMVSDRIPVSIAPGVYFLRVSLGGQLYSVKLLKI